jgi:hypothetical protein
MILQIVLFFALQTRIYLKHSGKFIVKPWIMFFLILDGTVLIILLIIHCIEGKDRVT